MAMSAQMRRIGGLLGLLAAMTVTVTSGAPARSAEPGLVLAGPSELVFDWESERCARWDIPDTPARAWRGKDGRVRLVAGSEQSRMAVGETLDQLTRACRVLHAGAQDQDPAAYDDRAWIASTFTSDGTRVEALVHVEYHGHLRPSRCPAARYSECWRNAIVQVVSEDGGASFSANAPGAGLVATLPYAYDGDQPGREGYFNPSNILRDGDHLYAFVFAEAVGAQRRGPCLLRRAVTGGAADWRAWDGAGFTRAFVDPYRTTVHDPAEHVCAPIAGIGSTISSVVRHAQSGLYIAVTPTVRSDIAGIRRSGIYWMTSPDLIRWSEPEMLLAVPLLWRRDCAAPYAYAYPALLDAESTSPNFDTVDDALWLYLVEMRLNGDCAIGPDRDLVRLPVRWRAPAAPVRALPERRPDFADRQR